jgi:hypothetical protein
MHSFERFWILESRFSKVFGEEEGRANGVHPRILSFSLLHLKYRIGQDVLG